MRSIPSIELKARSLSQFSLFICWVDFLRLWSFLHSIFLSCNRSPFSSDHIIFLVFRFSQSSSSCVLMYCHSSSPATEDYSCDFMCLQCNIRHRTVCFRDRVYRDQCKPSLSIQTDLNWQITSIQANTLGKNSRKLIMTLVYSDIKSVES